MVQNCEGFVKADPFLMWLIRSITEYHKVRHKVTQGKRCDTLCLTLRDFVKQKRINMKSGPLLAPHLLT